MQSIITVNVVNSSAWPITKVLFAIGKQYGVSGRLKAALNNVTYCAPSPSSTVFAVRTITVKSIRIDMFFK